MKVVICWMGYSGYAVACWRELASRDGMDLFVIARAGTAQRHVAFEDSLLDGVDCAVLRPEHHMNPARVVSIVVEQKPDIVVLSGWSNPAYVRLPFHRALNGVRFVMGMDTPRRGTLRQWLGRWRYGRFFKRIDRVVVAGERSWQLARLLGFSESKIRRGTYGIDYEALAPLHEHRLKQDTGWPRRFLFIGRYVNVKGLDTLLEAYASYRSSVTNPWPLSCCGQGPMKQMIDAAEGVVDLGFVQPSDQPEVFIRHGVLVLASRFDPWPLAIVESCAAGLPIICSEACGSSVELVRPYLNGLTCATDDADAMANAMRWVREHYDQLPEMKHHSRQLAAGYSAQIWADRWLNMFKELDV